jgi:uncharacterized protein DUF1629
MYYLFDAIPGPFRWIGEDKQQEYWSDNKVSWITGNRFVDDLIPNPLEFNFQPIKGTWDHGEYLPDFLKGASMPLIHNDVVNALIGAGVDNIDYYPTRITYPESEEVCTSYKAINIIGLIGAADMDKSKTEVHDNIPLIDVSFDKLILDDAKTHNVLIFRMAESNNTILIHDRVKNYFKSNDINNIKFHDLDAVGIL